MAVAEGLVAIATSSHRWALEPGESIESMHQVSPISFGLPAGEEPPLVIDFGTHITKDFNTEEFFEKSPVQHAVPE